MIRRRLAVATLAAAAGLAGLTGATGALAQDNWPARPVTIVVPFPAGGAADVVGRLLAERLRQELNQTFLIDNKAGAATALGATTVARAAKDGYTVLLSSGTTFTVNPHLNDKLAYTLQDFEPVAPVVTLPFAFVVKKDFPAKTVAEFAAYAKANPGKVNNATNGQGSMVHLLGELVARGLDVNLTHIHYRGAAPATMDMIAGIVDSNVEALTSAVPNVQTGKYRALAVLSEQRLQLMPDVPTFKELGYPSVVGETWFAVFAPAGTPKAIVERFSAALNRITSSASFAEEMRKRGNEPRSGSPEQLLKVTQDQSNQWGELIRRLNIKAE